MKKNYQSKIIGFLFLLGGIVYLGEQLGYWNFTIFFPGWWTIFLILPAIFSMVESGVHMGNLLLFALGGYFLLDAFDWIDFRLTFGAVVAILCIAIGMRLVLGKRRDTNRKCTDTKNVSEIHSNVFCGSRRFRGTGVIESMDAQCMLGSQYIDLSEADVRNCENIKLDCVLGNIDIIVPEEMNYVVKKDNLFGSCFIQDEPLGRYDIYVDISCVLGQVNLRKRKVEQFKEGKFKEKP